MYLSACVNTYTHVRKPSHMHTFTQARPIVGVRAAPRPSSRSKSSLQRPCFVDQPTSKYHDPNVMVTKHCPPQSYTR